MREITIVFNVSVGEVSNEKLRTFSDKFTQLLDENNVKTVMEHTKIDLDLSPNQLLMRVSNNNEMDLPLVELVNAAVTSLKSIFVNNVIGLNFVYNEDVEVQYNVFEDENHKINKEIFPNINGIGKKFSATINGKSVEAIIEPSYNMQRAGMNNYLYFHCMIPINDLEEKSRNFELVINEAISLTNELKEISLRVYTGVDSDDSSFEE